MRHAATINNARGINLVACGLLLALSLTALAGMFPGVDPPPTLRLAPAGIAAALAALLGCYAGRRIPIVTRAAAALLLMAAAYAALQFSQPGAAPDALPLLTGAGLAALAMALLTFPLAAPGRLLLWSLANIIFAWGLLLELSAADLLPQTQSWMDLAGRSPGLGLICILTGLGLAANSMQIQGMAPARWVLPDMSITLLFGILASAFLWQGMARFEEQKFTRETRLHGTSIADQIRHRLEIGRGALERMAFRSQERGTADEEQWRSDARLFLASEELFASLILTSSLDDPGWQEPNTIGAPTISPPEGFSAAWRARLRNPADLPESAVLVQGRGRQGRPGLLLILPVLPENQQQPATLVGSIQIPTLFIRAAAASLGLGFGARIRLNDQILYQNSPMNDQLMQTVALPMLGPGWQLDVGPTSDLSDSHSSAIPLLTLAACLIATLLITGLAATSLLMLEQRRVMAATRNALQHANDRFEAAMRGSRIGIFEWNIKTSETTIIAGFVAGGSGGGGPLEDIALNLPGPTEVTARLHPDDLPLLREKVRQHLRSGVPYEAEIRFRRDDGDFIWVLARGQAIRDALGQAQRIIGSLEDIDDLKRQMLRMEEQQQALAAQARRLEQVAHDLETARDAAESANRAKSAFLAMMSHEIRTPMNGVLGMLSMLRNADLDQRLRRFADIAEDSARDLLHLIDDILDVSKLEAGKTQLEVTDFEIQDIVDAVMTLNRPRAEAGGNELVAEVDPGVPEHLLGDPLRLRQIINNLVGNAAKFTEKGRIELRISARNRDSGRFRLHCEVRDTGIGIAPENHATLFQPFTQADPSITRKYGGTGLGLTICRNLVTLMGGEIGLASELGKGSTFWFEIPLEEDIEMAERLRAFGTGG